MSRPATAYDETRKSGESGWPLAPVHRLPTRPVPAPPRRSFLDRAWIVLAVLGLAAAAAAALWYLSVRPTPLAKQVAVPPVVGAREQFAVAALTDAGFNVRAIELPGKGRKGTVFAQRPAAKTVIARGSTVTIRVANGQKPAATAPAKTHTQTP